MNERGSPPSSLLSPRRSVNTASSLALKGRCSCSFLDTTAPQTRQGSGSAPAWFSPAPHAAGSGRACLKPRADHVQLGAVSGHDPFAELILIPEAVENEHARGGYRWGYFRAAAPTLLSKCESGRHQKSHRIGHSPETGRRYGLNEPRTGSRISGSPSNSNSAWRSRITVTSAR